MIDEAPNSMTGGQCFPHRSPSALLPSLPDEVLYAPIGMIVTAPNGERWVRLASDQAARVSALVRLPKNNDTPT